MKNFGYILTVTAIMLLSLQMTCEASQLEGIKDLDRMLDRRAEFTAAKAKEIDDRKARLALTKNDDERYSLLSEITALYNPFQCDSLLKYSHRMVDVALALKDSDKLCKALILLAKTQTKCGLYEEAFVTLKSISHKDLKADIMDAYYWTYCNLYGTKAYITRDVKMAENIFLPEVQKYRDSLDKVVSPNSIYYYEITVSNLRSNGLTNDVIELSTRMLDNHTDGRPSTGLLWYDIAVSKRTLGDEKGMIEAFVNSAISDLKCGTKDHASLHEIARHLFDKGDVKRAARYMQICMEDAMFFNANLRGIQIGQTLPMIVDAYNRRNTRHKVMLVFLTLLTGISLIICAFSLRKSNRHRKMLRAMTQKLEIANENLSCLNLKLQESDYIKESYVAHFIRQNSRYIGKSHDLLLQINKCLRKGKIEEALTLASNAIQDEEDVSSFHEAFDAAFLSIFPDFVEKFNELLKDDYKYKLKDFQGGNKTLSSELRVFAMIRLGFSDSATLAEMLRYSVNSIYNIRSKAKAKSAVPKGDFEEMVKKIGAM